MIAVDWRRVSQLLESLYDATDALEAMFDGRSFALDGHLVGSIGEVVAAYIFDLELEAASNKGFDAKARCDRREVEIKFTQSKSVGIRHDVEHLIVMQKLRGQRLRVVYNGRGASVWGSGKTASNGQKQISIAALQKLDALEPAEGRLPLINQPPI